MCLVHSGNKRKIRILITISSVVLTCRKDEIPVHGVSEKVIGVLGGGQLGRMLCQAASKLAIKIAILDPLVNCPASSLAYYHMVGNFDDSTTVQKFAKRYIFLRSHPSFSNILFVAWIFFP